MHLNACVWWGSIPSTERSQSSFSKRHCLKSLSSRAKSMWASTSPLRTQPVGGAPGRKWRHHFNFNVHDSGRRFHSKCETLRLQFAPLVASNWISVEMWRAAASLMSLLMHPVPDRHLIPAGWDWGWQGFVAAPLCLHYFSKVNINGSHLLMYSFWAG